MKSHKLLISLLVVIAILLLIVVAILVQPQFQGGASNERSASNASVMKECASWRENAACFNLFWKTATEYDIEGLNLQAREVSELTSFM